MSTRAWLIAAAVAVLVIVIIWLARRKSDSRAHFSVDDSMAAQELAASVPSFDAGALDRSLGDPSSPLYRLLAETSGSQRTSY